MQKLDLITPLVKNHLIDLLKSYRRIVLRVWYVRIEILSGFDVFIHRFRDRSAVLTYNANGMKVFKYHIPASSLQELFAMLEYCENGDREQQFVIGKFEFRIRSLGDAVAIGVEFLSHDVEMAGPRSQLKAAISEYHSLHRGLARIPREPAYARDSSIGRH